MSEVHGDNEESDFSSESTSLEKKNTGKVCGIRERGSNHKSAGIPKSAENLNQNHEGLMLKVKEPQEKYPVSPVHEEFKEEEIEIIIQNFKDSEKEKV